MPIAQHILSMPIDTLPAQLGHIFYFIVLPMLLLASVGFVIQRRLRLDMQTLTGLNFYFVIPGMIYYAIVSSRVTAAQAGTAVLLTLALMACMTAITYAAARIRRIPSDQVNPLIMTTIYTNSGNYGLPLQGLAFGQLGLSNLAMNLQSFVMITQNVTSFTFGVLLAASGRQDRRWKENLLHVAKFPPIYALAAGLITVQVRIWLGDAAGGVAEAIGPFWKVVLYVKDAFVGVAVFTLGAQLATLGPMSRSYPVKLSVLLKLLVAPAVGLGLIYALGVKGLLAQVLLIGTCTPTAVNTMLLCMEFDNHPGFAARAVLYSTLLSPITVTLVIFLAQGGILPGFGMEAPAGITQAGTKETAGMKRNTTVSIQGDSFLINGRPTYEGRFYKADVGPACSIRLPSDVGRAPACRQAGARPTPTCLTLSTTSIGLTRSV